MTAVEIQRITRDVLSYRYDRDVSPRLVVEPGSRILVETGDARDGALFDREIGSLFVLPKPTPGRGNPLTGPISVTGAAPGDSLVVDIDRIELVSPGWCGAHAHVGPLPEGRIPLPLGRICAVDATSFAFSKSITLPLRPMIGCIGTAPADSSPHAGLPGHYGGNVDHLVISDGARVHLPVFVSGGLLYLGDVHASQGDGELSGVALEIAAEVSVTLDVAKGAGLSWPWVEYNDRIAVLTTDPEFPGARAAAVEAVLCALESQLGLQPAEGLALISAVGDLRVGQAYGGMPLTLRLEMPSSLGLRPA